MKLGINQLQALSFPVWDSYKAFKEHRSVPGEFVRSSFANSWPLLVTAGMGLGAAATAQALFMLPAIPALATGIYGYSVTRNSYLRQAATPFSHRFTHSEFAGAAQQQGMASIQGAQSLIGSEAGQFAQRYSRR